MRSNSFALNLFLVAATSAVSSSTASSAAFVAPPSKTSSPNSNHVVFRLSKNDDEKSWDVDEGNVDSVPSPLVKLNIPNPLNELAEMFSSLDDVIDDFFNKRMGNGEIFYGKRKFKPSGSVESEYNGYGFTDFRKIEAAREFREERARMKEEMQEKMNAEKKER